MDNYALEHNANTDFILEDLFCLSTIEANNSWNNRFQLKRGHKIFQQMTGPRQPRITEKGCRCQSNFVTSNLRKRERNKMSSFWSNVHRIFTLVSSPQGEELKDTIKRRQSVDLIFHINSYSFKRTEDACPWHHSYSLANIHAISFIIERICNHKWAYNYPRHSKIRKSQVQ